MPGPGHAPRVPPQPLEDLLLALARLGVPRDDQRRPHPPRRPGDGLVLHRRGQALHERGAGSHRVGVPRLKRLRLSRRPDAILDPVDRNETSGPLLVHLGSRRRPVDRDKHEVRRAQTLREIVQVPQARRDHPPLVLAPAVAGRSRRRQTQTGPCTRVHDAVEVDVQLLAADTLLVPSRRPPADHLHRAGATPRQVAEQMGDAHATRRFRSLISLCCKVRMDPPVLLYTSVDPIQTARRRPSKHLLYIPCPPSASAGSSRCCSTSP